MSDPVDGNAIAGDLQACLQVEPTTAAGRCQHCGTRSVLAELVVYLRDPSPVARCPECGSVVFVLHRFRDSPQIHWSGYDVDDARAD